MRRREFLTVSVAATAAAGVGVRGAAADGTVAVGGFRLALVGVVLTVTHEASPERVLWETDPGGAFLQAERAKARNEVRGLPDGSFDIVDAVAARWEGPVIDGLAAEGDGAVLTGQLSGPEGTIGFHVAFAAAAPDQLRFVIGVEDGSAGVNRIRLRLGSVADEGFFGFGQQLTYFDQKGHLLPILVQEHGIGRGRRFVTRALDLVRSQAGGNPYDTECPAPHFITSRLRSMFLENEEYSTFDLRQAEAFDVRVWSGTMTGRILHGASPLELIESYTDFAGRMRPLPDWVHAGVIAGVQGGTAVVRRKLGELRDAGVPLAGLWIQDWTGTRKTDVGVQLWWNWTLDEGHYPDWDGLVAELAEGGGRVLVYINPFLADAPGHDAMYREAAAKGYLIRRGDGAVYPVRNTDFHAGMIDLANPEARDWIKAIVRDTLIGRLGASGWMNDFGEALMLDAKLHGGADPWVWHNHYPTAWAEVSREAIEETGRGADITFFDRSGFTRSPGASTLFWLGDQLQDWDQYDGIKTAVVGLLSGGVSGFSLLHSDTGGYVVMKLSLDGRTLPLIARTPELLMRWMELNAFTAVFRTHEGLDPPASAQFDTNAATMAHMLRFAKVYRGLGAYRKALVAEAAAHGHPVVRHPFLHYPADATVRGLRYQFLLGPDLMVAPVLDPGRKAVDVYFPEGDAWTDLWTGADAGAAGEWLTMPAPLGRPAVFLRKGAPTAELILGGLRSEGVLR